MLARRSGAAQGAESIEEPCLAARVPPHAFCRVSGRIAQPNESESTVAASPRPPKSRLQVFRNNGDGGPVSDYADPTCGMDSRPAPQRCTISGLQRGRTYSFQIAAINEIGESKRSMEQQFRAAAVPAKIGTLRSLVRAHFFGLSLGAIVSWAQTPYCIATRPTCPCLRARRDGEQRRGGHGGC